MPFERNAMKSRVKAIADQFVECVNNAKRPEKEMEIVFKSAFKKYQIYKASDQQDLRDFYTDAIAKKNLQRKNDPSPAGLVPQSDKKMTPDDTNDLRTWLQRPEIVWDMMQVDQKHRETLGEDY